MNDLAWAVTLTPLGGLLLAYLVDDARAGARAATLGTLATALLALIFFMYHYLNPNLPVFQSVITLWSFTPYQHALGGLDISTFVGQIGVRADGFSVSAALVISWAAFLAQLACFRNLRADEGLRRHTVALQLLFLGAMASVAAPNLLTLLIAWGVSAASLPVLAVGRVDAAMAARWRLAVVVQVAAVLVMVLVLAIVVYKYSASLVTSTILPAGESAADPFDFGRLQALFLLPLREVPGVGIKTEWGLGLAVLAAVWLRAGIVPFRRLYSSFEKAPGAISSAAIGLGFYVPAITLLVRFAPLFAVTPGLAVVLGLAGVVAVVDGTVGALRERETMALVSAGGRFLFGVSVVALACGGVVDAEIALLCAVVAVTFAYTTTYLLVRTFRSHDSGDIAEVARRAPWVAELSRAGLLAAAGVVPTAAWWSGGAVLSAIMVDRGSRGAAAVPGFWQWFFLVAVLGAMVLLPAAMVAAVLRMRQPAFAAFRRGFRLDRIVDVSDTRRLYPVLLFFLMLIVGLLLVPWGGPLARQLAAPAPLTVDGPLPVAYVLEVLAAVAGGWLAWAGRGARTPAPVRTPAPLRWVAAMDSGVATAVFAAESAVEAVLVDAMAEVAGAVAGGLSRLELEPHDDSRSSGEEHRESTVRVALVGVVVLVFVLLLFGTLVAAHTGAAL